jgi:hypothetical protein
MGAMFAVLTANAFESAARDEAKRRSRRRRRRRG